MIARIKHFFSINWYQTIKINGRVFPLSTAVKMPIIVYKGFRIKECKGSIIINAPVTSAMIGFGQPYEIFTRSKKSGEATINGTIIFNGSVQFGVDTKLYVLENAKITFGDINSFATGTQIICFKEIVFGNWVQCGSNCLFVDTNFHYLKQVGEDRILPRENSIYIGNYVYIGTRVTIRQKTKIPNHTLISSVSLCNKDYTAFGEQVTLGGVPATLLSKGIIRDWESEEKGMRDYLKIKL